MGSSRITQVPHETDYRDCVPMHGAGQSCPRLRLREWCRGSASEQQILEGDRPAASSSVRIFSGVRTAIAPAGQGSAQEAGTATAAAARGAADASAFFEQGGGIGCA